MTQVPAKAPAAWQFFQQMLADVTKIVTDDAESERELLEGLRVIARVSSLCAQLSVEADPDRPSFFDMCSPTRMIGGPNPDGNYYLAMIRGDRRYRITGTRGTSAYLGFQILAGTGLTPRRMANYVSDVDLDLASGEFALVLSSDEPADLAGAQWVLGGSMYTLKLRERGVVITQRRSDTLRDSLVRGAMSVHVDTIPATATFAEIMEVVRSTEHSAFPVVDEGRRLRGLLLLAALPYSAVG